MDKLKSLRERFEYSYLKDAFRRHKPAQSREHGITGGLSSASAGKFQVSILPPAFQTGFAFVAVLLNVALAVSQRTIGVSGAVGFSFFLLGLNLIASTIILTASWLHLRRGKAAGLMRALKTVRVGLVVAGSQAFFSLLCASLTTIAANTSGCKEATDDPHASDNDWMARLPAFCGTRRALAAFCWLLCFTWMISLVSALRHWKQVRNEPNIPPFDPAEVAYSKAAELEQGEEDIVEKAAPPRVTQYDAPPASMRIVPPQPTVMHYDPLRRSEPMIPGGYSLQQQQSPPSYEDPFVRLRSQYGMAGHFIN